MIGLPLPTGALRLLCLGAHSDDIEIGCGGTLLELLAGHPGSSVHTIVFSGGGTPREAEAQDAAKHFLASAAKRTVGIHTLKDGHFPQALSEVKAILEAARAEGAPDVVFTHYRDDRHQDHRTISDAAWQTFRDHLVLEYEIPKWDGDLGQPNFYVPLSTKRVREKADHLLAAFPSQRTKRWFTAETFAALPRLRGIECGAPDGYAEAYYARKVLLDHTARG